MQTGFLHTHVLVNVLFMLLLAVKTTLLVINKTETLEKLRAKTKIADIVLGVLILVTGGYLVTIQETVETWLIVKIVIVVACIPLGIIGISKGKKVLAILSLFGFLYVYGVAETRSLSMQKKTYTKVVETVEESPEQISNEIVTENTTVAVSNGQAIYESLCVQCHGSDGKLGKYNAKDLTMSAMTAAEKATIIANGKGMMNGFGKDLSESEIAQVVEYIGSLGKAK